MSIRIIIIAVLTFDLSYTSPRQPEKDSTEHSLGWLVHHH